MGGGGKRGGGSASYVVGHRYYAGLHLPSATARWMQ